MSTPLAVSSHPSRTGSLSRYAAIIWYLTYTELRAESERTYIGFLWWIIEPLVSLAVYSVVFGLILVRAIDNYVAFLFVGLVPWRWLHTTLMHGCTSILASKSVMRQVYLPKLIFPIVAFLTDSFKFVVVFLLVIAFCLISGFPLTIAYVALPLVILIQGGLVFGVTTIAAAVTPFFPDVRIVLENLVRLWFFLSGIFYSVDSFPENVQIVFRINPIVPLLEGYRDILLHGRFPDLPLLALIGLGAVALCALGVWLIHKFDFRYPKLAL